MDPGSVRRFETWVNQRLGLCLTCCPRIPTDEVFHCFDIDPTAAVWLPMPDREHTADDMLAVGQDADWTFAIEGLTTRGSDESILTKLSLVANEAFSIAITQSIKTFLYAECGNMVSGIDLTVPTIRWGPAPHRFDRWLRSAGLLESTPDPISGVARFIGSAFGFRIESAMLEGALPTARLS